MRHYPAYLVLCDRPCLVVGGGAVAERKTLKLLEAGGEVTVVAPSLTPKLADLAHRGKIMHRPRLFEEHDLSGMFLAVAATDTPATNTAIARLCRRMHVLVNVVAPPEESTFIVPSVVERGNLLIAVSTGGASPGLAKRIREELERTFGEEYGLFVERLAALRNRLAEDIADEAARRRVLDAVLDSDVLYLLKNGAVHEADLRIAEIVRHELRGATGGTSPSS